MLPPMHRDEVPYAAGLELALETTGEAWVTVRGRSMLPFIWPGARLRVVHASVEDVAVGDVVVVVRGADPVIHRVVRVDAGRVITRGDAYLNEDVHVQGERLVATVSGLGLGRTFVPMPKKFARRFGGIVADHGVCMLRTLIPASRFARTVLYRARRTTAAIAGRSMPGFEIRGATAADAVAIEAYTRERGIGTRFDHTGMSIALRDSTIVGSLRLDPRSTTPERLLIDLFVAPSCRGYGVGAELVRHVVDRTARSEGVSGLVAAVRSGNPSSRCFERAGFTRRKSGSIEEWCLHF